MLVSLRSPTAGAGWSAAQRKPGELARNRDRNLRGRLMFGHQLPEATAQTLLRFVRDRNHAAWLPLAPPRQRDPDARPMLIMPGRFDQQPPDQRVPRPRDAAAPMLLPAGVLAWAPARDTPSTPAPRRSDESHATPPGSASPSTYRCRGNTAATPPARDTDPPGPISVSRASRAASRASS